MHHTVFAKAGDQGETGLMVHNGLLCPSQVLQQRPGLVLGLVSRTPWLDNERDGIFQGNGLPLLLA